MRYSTPLYMATATTVSLAVSASSIIVAHSLTLTATVTPSGASGHVLFYDGVIQLASVVVSAGVAAYTYSPAVTGSHCYSCQFVPGDASGIVVQQANESEHNYFSSYAAATVFGGQFIVWVWQHPDPNTNNTRVLQIDFANITAIPSANYDYPNDFFAGLPTGDQPLSTGGGTIVVTDDDQASLCTVSPPPAGVVNGPTQILTNGISIGYSTDVPKSSVNFFPRAVEFSEFLTSDSSAFTAFVGGTGEDTNPACGWAVANNSSTGVGMFVANATTLPDVPLVNGSFPLIKPVGTFSLYRQLNVTNAVCTSNVVTLTAAGHGLSIGDVVQLNNFPSSPVNYLFLNNRIVTLTGAATDTFTFSVTHANAATHAVTAFANWRKLIFAFQIQGNRYAHDGDLILVSVDAAKAAIPTGGNCLTYTGNAAFVASHIIVPWATFASSGSYTIGSIAPINDTDFVGVYGSRHIIVVTDDGVGSGDVARLNAVTGARVTFRANDNAFVSTWKNGNPFPPDALQSVCRIGVGDGKNEQTFSAFNANLALPGDYVSSSAQRGGIIRMVDPSTLTAAFSWDVTKLVMNSGLTPLPVTQNDLVRGKVLPPLSSILWLDANNSNLGNTNPMALVTFGYTGSCPFLVTLPIDGTYANSVSNAVTVSVGPNFTITGTLLDPSGNGTPGTIFWQLEGLGGLIPQTSLYMMIPPKASCAVASDGTWSITLWGRDQIVNATSTFYSAEFVSSDGLTRKSLGAFVLTGGGTWDITMVPQA